MNWKWPTGDTHFEQHGEWWQYQLHNKNSFRKHTPQGNVIDCGAHVGTWTCWLAQHYKHIYSIEPVHHSTLQHNVRATDTHNVTVIPHAVSDTHETKTIWVRQDNSGDTGFLDSTQGRQPQTIKTVTIDSLELDSITGIKMDLQGHELEALLGAEHTVEQYKPTLCVELGKGNTVIELLLEEWQYRLVERCGKDWIYKHSLKDTQ